MILERPYNKEAFEQFLKDFLPDYEKDEHAVRTPDKSILTEVVQLGASKATNVAVLDAECEETDSGKRIAITQAAFKVLREHGWRNALIAFHDGADQWRLSLLTSTLELKDGKVVKKDSNPRRYSYLLGIGAKTRTPHRYLVEKGRVEDNKALQERFSVEVVNKQFYESIADLFTKLVGGERGKIRHPGLLKIHGSTNQNNEHQEFAVRLIGRIIFSWFLKEKKSTAGVPIVPDELLSLSAVAAHGDYYHSILEPLFFELLNKRVNNRHESLREIPFSTVPYLNGGLFSPQPGDYYNQNSFNGAGTPGLTHVPDSWFTELFTILEQYNFTVDENTSYDVDLSIDPEMLGRIFENLLAEINPETGESARKSTGSFYTPREIVDYMVDNSLLEYLKTNTGIKEDKLLAIISWGQEDDQDHPLTDSDRKKIVDSLATLTILDPACGSGAFPIGLLQKVVYILQQVDVKAEIWLENQLKYVNSPELRRDIEEKYRSESYDWLRKLGVIRESIFGVDIQTIATEIAKLRCFLTLIIEEDVDDRKDNRGIRPLPNLDFKFVTANSLVGLPDNKKDIPKNSMNLFEDKSHIERLKAIRNQYFGADADERSRLQVEFKDLQLSMFKSRVAAGGATSDLYNTLSDWNPFSHDKTDWFDSEWMFGVDGFDIVIANPPYVRNERIPQRDKTQLQSIFLTPFDQWSLYIVFFELAVNLLESSGVFCFISPNQWLSAKYGTKLRVLLADKVLSLTDFRNFADFENASVNTFITIGKANPVDVPAEVIVYDDIGSTTNLSIERSVFNDMKDNLGATLSKDIAIINRIKSSISDRIANHYKAGHSFSIPDFYKLSDIIVENSSPSKEDLKLVNTGTLSLLGSNWGSKKFKYNKTDYAYPIVSKTDFRNMFPTRSIQAEPKLIIASMGGLNIDIDLHGEYLGTRPTMWLSSSKSDDLKIAFALLRSTFIDWFYRQQYSVAGMTGFKVRYGQIEDTPIPNIIDKQREQIIGLVDEIISIRTDDSHADISAQESEIDTIVYKLYGLTEEEIKIVEG